MKKITCNLGKSAQWLGSICAGLLISLPTISQTALAQQRTNSQVNPCPRIFYEEPHNSRVLVPQGCPPNTLTQRMGALGLIPIGPMVPGEPSPEQTRSGVGGEAPSGVNPNSGSFNQSPNDSFPRNTSELPNPPQNQQNLPERDSVPSRSEPQAPIARIALNNGRLNLKLINETGEDVTYQAIGDTAMRWLKRSSSVTLQDLTAPVTVTVQREKGGPLMITPNPTSQAGNLELVLQAATDADMNRGAIRIEDNGAVFLS